MTTETAGGVLVAYVIGAIIVWMVVPMFVAHAVGKPKNRAGFLYGFFLGWLGVLAVAVLPPRPERTPMDLLEEARRGGRIKQDEYETLRSEFEAAKPRPMHRECPHCREEIRRDASACPHCQRDVEPWTLHGDRWWVQRPDGWLVLDDTTGQWAPFEPPSPAPAG
jgi:hypothetical protein